MEFILQFSRLLGVGGTLGCVAALAAMVAALITYPRYALLVCLPLALVFTLLLWPLGRRAHILAYGVAAEARVLGAERGGIAIKIGGSRSQSRVRLTLEVLRPNQSSVRAEVVTYILQYNLPDFAPGKTVRVKYDPDEPSRVAVIEEDTYGRL